LKTTIKAGIIIVACFGALQLIRPPIHFSPSTATEVQVPQPVRQILKKDCYSCHSDERGLAWFDEVVPAWWLVRHDILTARHHLNFSTLGAKPAPAQRAALFEAVNMIQLGAMPLPQFVALHPHSEVTPEELTVLKNYLAPWSGDSRTVATGTASTEAEPFQANLSAIPAELNGVPFEPSFENWHPISFTDRGDNNTLRMILGNDIAVNAAKSGNISPWPDGASFAKIAWQKAVGEDGFVYPGNFVQVEFMVRDARRYKQTNGWGWGRWRGTALKPYGSDPHFAGECTGCHKPMLGDDDVYTLPISSAKVDGKEAVNNRAGALSTAIPYPVLDWRAITMYVDPVSHTMATLYGNDAAVLFMRSRNRVSSQPPGAVLALVTWYQRDDPHWFGGRIPDTPKSIEFVQSDASGNLSCRFFAGTSLTEEKLTSNAAAAAIKFTTNLRSAWLP
jgi:hypothetical protein